MEDRFLQLTEQALVDHWQIRPMGVSPYDLNRQLLLEALSERILYLLRSRPEKLLSALYILDVGERAYALAMEQDTMETRAWALAESVYDRETEKIRSREKYAREYGRERIGPAGEPESRDGTH